MNIENDFKTKKEKKKIELFYNEKGEPNSIEEGITCAKYLERGERKKYYVLSGISSAIYNPNMDKITFKNKVRFKLREVQEDCFMLYLGFLQKRDMKSFNKAKRLSIN